MTTLVDAPARVDGVELIGEMVGSGYRSPPALVRRADGQVLQLTPLLFLVLSSVDGARDCAEVAAHVGRALGRPLTEGDVRVLIDTHLRPLGLVKAADGSEPELRRSDPLLRLKPRFAITDPVTTRRVTDPFRVLFNPLVTLGVAAAFAAVVGWVFFERGLGASAYDAFQRPHLLLLVFVVSVLSAGFHEFGHAAAARYGGGQPGAMGAGLYLVWPAFYTDVTDSYRLGRAARIRTDLGGLYFNAIVVVITFACWWTTRWEALLLLVATQVLQMVQQVQPLLRFDGYHVLADLAGVPDLYQRIRPTLLGLLPHRWRSTENRVLTPWARTLITLWVLVTVPMMAMMLLALIRAVPRLLGSAGSSLRENTAALAGAWSSASWIDVAAQAVQLLGVILPVLAGALVLGRTGYRFVRGLIRWSRDSAPRRAAAAVVAAGVVGALVLAWWPDSNTYRPIQPGERGTVTSLLPAQPIALEETRAMTALPAGLTRSGLAAKERLARSRHLTAVFEQGRPMPTREHPSLAMVLVPSEATSGGSAATATLPPADADPSDAPDDIWVFPFDKPLPPSDGDNQALAVATKDGSLSYDVAFALVWAEGDEVVNVNEAHAYASCTDCIAVAVAFQVVLVMDNAHVVVPQNLAVAANYQCHQCITAAIASQLVLSVETRPGEEQLHALAAVWNRLIDFAGNITSYSLPEISDRLETVKAEIMGILGAAPAITTPATPTETATPSMSPSTTGPTPDEPTASQPPATLDPTSSPSPSTQEQAPDGTTPTASQPPATLDSTSSPSPSTQEQAPDGTTPTATPEEPTTSPTAASPSAEPSSTAGP